MRACPTQPPPYPSETASYQALLAYAERTQGEARLPPEGEIMASYDLSSGTKRHDRRYLDAIRMGLRAPDCERITVPALAIFAVPASPEALMAGRYDREDQVLRETVAELSNIHRRRKEEAMATR